MLVRLEVDGFKNLLGFTAELGPFTCVAGPNGTGKSNVFDAIRFLSLLADHPLEEAARRVRGPTAGPPAPEELFWTDGVARTAEMRFAAELLVEGEARDDFGRPVSPSATLLRYELALGLAPPAGPGDPGRLVLRHEALHHVNKGDAHRHLRFPHSAGRFREAMVHNHRSGGALISTEPGPDGAMAVRVHGDGGHPGLLDPSPVERAPATVVSVTTTGDRPTILAARREMQRWRRLSLEPGAMRCDDGFSAPRALGEDGARLPATLFRLAMEDADGPEAAYARVARRVAPLAPIEAVRVDRDDYRRVLRLEARVDDGAWLPARALSDGTLRALGLGLTAADAQPGVLCVEEPENGIHPSRLEALARLLRAMAVDPQRRPGPDNPLRQLVVNTHSPALVELLPPDEVVLAESVEVEGPAGRRARTVRFAAPPDTWRAGPVSSVGLAEAMSALRTPRGSNLQLALDFDEG